MIFPTLFRVNDIVPRARSFVGGRQEAFVESFGGGLAAADAVGEASAVVCVAAQRQRGEAFET